MIPGAKKGVFNYTYCNKKRMKFYKKKNYLIYSNRIAWKYLSKDETLTIHYQNGISNIF
jgi:hypothetical protein